MWDVLSATQLLRLQDIPAAADLLRDYTAAAGRPDRDSSSSSAAAGGSASPSSSGISSLAWVMPGSSVLAVVVAPALLLLWDVAGEQQRRDALAARCSHAVTFKALQVFSWFNLHFLCC